jgi:hypothetical protein
MCGDPRVVAVAVAMSFQLPFEIRAAENPSAHLSGGLPPLGGCCGRDMVVVIGTV